MKRFLMAAGLLFLTQGSVQAEGPNKMGFISKSTLDSIQKLAMEPVVVDDIEAQNKAKVDQGQDEELQRKWVRSTMISELVRNYREKKSCETMRDYFFREIVLMDCFTLDSRGRVVGTLYKPKNFLQDGDPLFVNCFNGGQGRVYVDQNGMDLAPVRETVEISVPVKKGRQTVGVLVARVLLDK